MPVRQIAAPILWGDGIHDDTEALKAWFDGTRVLRPNGLVAAPYLIGEKFRFHDKIFISGYGRSIENSWFWGTMPKELG